ncbi:MAG: PAS domain S-box protein [Dehalococcoidales bacterium]|nr:MAG: PAS domain S-box protein [Dehalococcoidales bacterium]
MEETVSLHERYFNTLMENMADAFSIVDADGTIRYFSDSLPRVLGYGPEEQVGDHFIEKVHPDGVAITINYYEQLLKEPSGKVQFEVQALHKDGSWR